MGTVRSAGRKVLHLLLVLFLVSVGTFFLTEVAPGDPAIAILGPNAAPEQYEQLQDRLGLDRSTTSRYVDWIGGAVRGDFGTTLVPPTQSVTDLVRSRLPVTMEIAVLAMLVALAVAVPAGVWSAYRAGRPAEAAVTGATFAVLSVPSFLAALLLVYAVILNRERALDLLAAAGLLVAGALLVTTLRRIGVRGIVDVDGLRAAAPHLVAVVVLAVAALSIADWFPVLPRQGFVRLTDSRGFGAHLRSLLLPAVTLGVLEGVVLLRVLRSDMITVLNEDYVMAARAKGLPDLQVLRRHALRPASLSLVTMAGVSFGRLLGGTVIMETIFRLPGMGTLLVDAVANKDFRVVQAGVLVVSFLYVATNALIDLSYEALDPRIGRGRR